MTQSDIQIEIRDFNGKLIKKLNKLNFLQGVLSLDLSDFRPGVYSCFIKTEDQIYNKEIIVIK